MNDLKNVEVKINDEDQTVLLLCSLPFSYKSFRETLIYDRVKLAFEEVKGHLLSKDKLNNELGLDSKTDRREKIMIISLKSGSLLGASFKKLGNCVREKQTRVSFDLAVHTLASKHKFGSINSLHSLR
ncbi:hypothetical protein Gotur_034322 [Gossypium turneri]